MTAISSSESSIVIVGSTGRIGSALAAHYARAGTEVWACARRADTGHRLDLAAPEDRWELPGAPRLAFICAAVTGLEACVRDPEGSRAINVDGAVRLARNLAERGCFVVFLSTSAVFDGQTPYPEPDSPVTPGSEYGRQKAEAEALLADLGERIAIVRPTKILSPTLPLFAGWRSRLAAGESVRPYADLPIAPISETFVANALATIGERRVAGISHLSASEDVSYADIALAMAAGIGLPATRVIGVRGEIRTDLFGAEPPRFAALDMRRTSAALDIPAPSPGHALATIADARIQR